MTESLPLLCHWLFFPNLFIVVNTGIDIQAQALSVKVQLVLARFLKDLSNVASVFDATKFDVTLALLDGVTNELGGSGFTLGANDCRLLLLSGLVDHESGSLGVLLGHLLGFDGSGEFRGESEVLSSVRYRLFFFVSEENNSRSKKHHLE